MQFLITQCVYLTLKPYEQTVQLENVLSPNCRAVVDATASTGNSTELRYWENYEKMEHRIILDLFI